MRPRALAVPFALAAALAAQGPAPAAPAVQCVRVPGGGLQPQLAVDPTGTLHLVIFRGDPAGGDLFYSRRAPGEAAFGAPLRVNREPGSAIATGTIRGAQLALGKDGRAHVVWNGSAQATPRGPDGETPVLYARLADGGAAFEPPKNLVRKAYGLDGGATVVADGQGAVAVAWHAGAGRGEESRRVILVRSADDGASFSAERAIDKDRLGACACCGMAAGLCADGGIAFLYRAARDRTHRDAILLTAADAGGAFAGRVLEAWEGKTCPMSSASFARTATATWVAWETGPQVRLQRLAAKAKEPPRSPPGDGRGRKHPRLATNARGELLLAWTEGTGWNRGGGLAWQLYDAAGQELPAKGEADGVPTWSFAAVAALPDGGFLVMY